MYLLLAGQMLGEKVGWVDLPNHLPHGKCLCPDLVLDPQRVSLQMVISPLCLHDALNPESKVELQISPFNML